MQQRWRVHAQDAPKARLLAGLAGVHPHTAQCLLNRGVATAQSAQRFLAPSLSSLDDPAGLPDLEKALSRIQQASARGESVFIFGDSDVDGITASVILFETLKTLGAGVEAVCSNRIEDGYGLPQALLQKLCASGVSLVILVDCGTNQPEAVRALCTSGIDTIIIDHHLPLENAAQPLALINPHCVPAAPFKEMCSAGLALKLAQALGGADESFWQRQLDLAALGTLADYAPLRNDNRTIVSAGLSRIIDSARPGLRRLCADTALSQPHPDHVLRKLVPRLNASGRLGDAQAVWQLLRQESDSHEALAARVESDHAATRQLQRQIMAEAREQVNRLHFKDQYVLVVSRSGWHQGLMGPLASQLAQQYGRPAIALAMDEEEGTGSARSIPMINLLNVLRGCQDVLIRFGGHAQACGLTISRKQLDAFRVLVNEQAKVFFGGQGPVAERWIDLQMTLSEIQDGWVSELDRFAPFGQGNARPTVMIRNVRVSPRSARMASLSDGTMEFEARGSFDGIAADARYDAIVSPALAEGCLRLAVSELRAAQP